MNRTGNDTFNPLLQRGTRLLPNNDLGSTTNRYAMFGTDVLNTSAITASRQVACKELTVSQASTSTSGPVTITTTATTILTLPVTQFSMGWIYVYAADYSATSLAACTHSGVADASSAQEGQTQQQTGTPTITISLASTNSPIIRARVSTGTLSVYCRVFMFTNFLS